MCALCFLISTTTVCAKSQLPHGVQVIIDLPGLNNADLFTVNDGANIITDINSLAGGVLPAGSVFKLKAPVYPQGTVNVNSPPYALPSGSIGTWWCQSIALVDNDSDLVPGRQLDSAIYTFEFRDGSIFTENVQTTIAAKNIPGRPTGKITGAIMGGTGKYNGATGELIGFIYQGSNGITVTEVTFR